MKVTVLYFARYREALGRGQETVEGAFTTLQELRDALLADGTRGVLAESGLMCARNETLCSLSEPVAEGDEIAFFPTVTGG
jgi:molybdopterin synthase sulfur carrier subunit